MNTSHLFRILPLRVFWPATMLLMLLQRTPVLRVLVSADFASGANRMGQLLRAAIPVALGASSLHTLTGATRFAANPASPATASVGTPFSAAFAVTGTPSVPRSYTITGLPAGLSVTSGTLSGTTWLLNGSNGSIAGTPTAAGQFTVRIRAWEKTGGTGDKSPEYLYELNVTGAANAPPAFTTQPNSQTVNSGASVSFTVQMSGTPAPTLQWRKDGANLAGQTSTTLALSTVGASDAGGYDCVATNSAGSTTSTLATIVVNTAPAASAPVFTQQPAPQSAAAGTVVVFTVAVQGSPAPTLQWRRDGTSLPGATTATLSLPAIGAADAGIYTCVATNSAGSVTSNGATLTITAAAALAITAQPVALTTREGGGAFFSVQATGAGLTYQWFKATNPISGATSASLFLSDIGTDDEGNYRVRVRDASGNEVMSSFAALNVTSSGSARLVNLSARAGVGSGADALIPGFVIDGDVALTLLIRGIGPALEELDVPGALADPVMSLYRGPTVVAMNDNWEETPDLVALNEATATTGAFALAPGSKDAAMLVTLNPGLYTVVISGKDSATGESLVELYVVGP